MRVRGIAGAAIPIPCCATTADASVRIAPTHARMIAPASVVILGMPCSAKIVAGLVLSRTDREICFAPITALAARRVSSVGMFAVADSTLARAIRYRNNTYWSYPPNCRFSRTNPGVIMSRAHYRYCPICLIFQQPCSCDVGWNHPGDQPHHECRIGAVDSPREKFERRLFLAAFRGPRGPLNP